MNGDRFDIFDELLHAQIDDRDLEFKCPRVLDLEDKSVYGEPLYWIKWKCKIGESWMDRPILSSSRV